MPYIDKDGNEVPDVFTKEELEKQIADAVEAAKKQIPPVPATPPEPEKKPEQTSQLADQIKQMNEQLQALAQSQQKSVVSRFVSGLDADKKAAFEQRFEKLQGYGQTPEEVERRAADAYLLEVGQPFDAGALNMANLAAAGGGKATVGQKKEMSEVDKQISAALGNTEEDFKKYAV